METEELLASKWLTEIKKTILIELKGIEGLINHCIYIAESPGGPEPYLDTVLKEREKLKSLKEN